MGVGRPWFEVALRRGGARAGLGGVSGASGSGGRETRARDERKSGGVGTGGKSEICLTKSDYTAVGFNNILNVPYDLFGQTKSTLLPAVAVAFQK